jgi:hypothetical protein
MLGFRTLLSLGIVMVFFTLAFNPLVANVTSENKTIKYTILSANGIKLHELELSEEDSKELDRLFTKLLEKIQKAANRTEVVEQINAFLKRPLRHPLLRFILGFILNIITFDNPLYEIRPLRKKVFIISRGFSSHLTPPKEKRVRLYRPFTIWYYSGRCNAPLQNNSRTVIVDLLPFNVETLTGRQIGIMRRFFGIYIYRYNAITDESCTFIFGHAAKIRGLELSTFSRV